MMVALQEPWTDEVVYADECWACGHAITERDTLTVVDAASPKIVHASDPCLTWLRQAGKAPRP